MLKYLLLCVIFVTLSGQISVSAEHRKKLVIDNDAGGDDAMGIFLALLREKHFNGPELVALTTVNGNAPESNVVINNQKILQVANRQDVPIYRGASRSLVHTPKASGYYGVDGLGANNQSLAGLVDAEGIGAAQALIDLSKKYEGDLTLVTLGPLSNVAMAINLDPQFLDRLDQLYIAAAHIQSELFPNPEFNAHTDVEAFHVVSNASILDKVTIFPFSQTKLSLNITKDWRTKVLGAINSDIIKAQNSYESVSLERSDFWHALDPAAVALAIHPELVDVYTSYHIDINLCGAKRGICQFSSEANNSNMRVVYSVKKDEYMQYLLDTFTADVGKENV